MINYPEIFVLLWLLPVFTQIIIPLVMLCAYLLVKTGKVIRSVFCKGAAVGHLQQPGLPANKLS